MSVAEEAVLTQTLALLPPFLIFGRIPQYFDTAVCALALNPKLHIDADILDGYYDGFIYYFAAPRSILGHYQEHSLTHLMLVTAFLSFFDSEVTVNLVITTF